MACGTYKTCECTQNPKISSLQKWLTYSKHLSDIFQRYKLLSRTIKFKGWILKSKTTNLNKKIIKQEYTTGNILIIKNRANKMQNLHLKRQHYKTGQA